MAQDEDLLNLSEPITKEGLEALECGKIFFIDEIIHLECGFCKFVSKQDESFSFFEHLIKEHLIIRNRDAIKIDSDCENKSNEFYNNNMKEDDGSNQSIEIKEELNIAIPGTDEHEVWKLVKSKNKKPIQLNSSKERNIQYPDVRKSNKDKKFHCPFESCERSFETLKLIRNHMRNIHILDPKIIENERFQCPLCDMNFKWKQNWARHLEVAHNTSCRLNIKMSIDGKYYCPDCNKACSKLYGLNNHMRTQHEGYFNKLMDEQQQEKEDNKNIELPVKRKYRKIKDITVRDDGLWHCPYCEVKKEPHKRRIDEHLRQKHYSNRVCDICGKEMSTLNSLKRHKLTHTGEKPHKCDYCEKCFADRTNFMNHVRIHTGEKRYKCDFCDKRFIQSTEKKIHEQKHKQDKSIQCEVCGKGFYVTAELRKHMRRHTGERPYSCKICDKSFYDNEHLKDHMLSHSDLKSFECDVCKTKFARKRNLRAHMGTHSSFKKYPCEYCNQSFSQAAGLCSHRKTHHKKINRNENEEALNKYFC